MTQDAKQDTKPRQTWGSRIVWVLLGLLLVGDAGWLLAPTIREYYQGWQDQRDQAYGTRMAERQVRMEETLRSFELPVFGPWEQVAPLSKTLAEVQEPERNPNAEARYTLVSGSQGSWVRMPAYVDGYPIPLDLKGIAPELLEYHVTVCLARTIVAKDNITIPVFLGSDGGFVLWLNGKSLLLSDAQTDAMRPGQEVVSLHLRPGENRLVLKIRLDRVPCEFFFLPDFGELRTEKLLADLDVDFKVRQSRAEDYRRRAAVSSTVAEEHYYRLQEFPVPEDVFLEGGGLRFLPDGRLAVGTRRGFVYVVEDILNNDPNRTAFKQYASGLHEALGLCVTPDGEIDVAQRGSLVRLKDRDRDGHADTFQNLNNAWGLSGNYHEYTLDLERDVQGNTFTSLSLSDTGGGTNVSLAPNRGWIVQITSDKTFVPWCFGLRCANGLGWNSEGDLFATDNQGQWVAASPIYHIQRDHYYGSPPSRDAAGPEASQESRRRGLLPPTPPAVWMPYEEFCMSATDLVCDLTGDKFGPFGKQMFVGDMMKGTIIRVAMEKVAGEYQGACFLFRRGVGAVNRMTFGPDHRLYLTRASRGWGGGGRGEGLARLEFTGETPMEIKTMSLTTQGFELQFTLPVSRESESLLRELRLEQFRYEYWGKYGSPKIDRELLAVQRAVVSPDRKGITIDTRGIKRGHVCHLVVPRISAETGQVLLHPDAFYTVNALRDDSAVIISKESSRRLR
jgi:glucose/arabinose dehydrogenase